MLHAQWIVTDLDETLLNRDRKISPRSLQAIRAIRNTGVKFAIATTRSRGLATAYIDLLQPDAMVLSGGALAYQGTALSYYKPIEAVHAARLLEQFSQSDEISSVVMDSASGRIVCDRGTILSPEVALYSIFFWAPEPTAKRIAEDWKDHCTVTALWQPEMYRISHRMATKHHALQSLFHEVTAGEVICFGDDLMDEGMLRHFYGVAVANAHPQVREASDEITLHHDSDGVAHWIESRLLL